VNSVEQVDDVHRSVVGVQECRRVPATSLHPEPLRPDVKCAGPGPTE